MQIHSNGAKFQNTNGVKSMNNTTYLNLKKPESADFVNIADFNDNSDTLDNAYHEIEQILSALSSEIETARSTFANLNARLDDFETRVSALENA